LETKEREICVLFKDASIKSKVCLKTGHEGPGGAG